MTDKRRIFLAHAREDKPQVRKLHADLKARGFDPWLDSEDLIPGQIWEVEIQKAIKTADAFLACLSSHSVSKTGYVQKEFRTALSAFAERPPGSIYLIPARLDDCDVPDLQIPEQGLGLRDLHWVDLWEDDGLDRLMSALAHATVIEPVVVKQAETTRPLAVSSAAEHLGSNEPPSPDHEDPSPPSGSDETEKLCYPIEWQFDDVMSILGKNERKTDRTFLVGVFTMRGKNITPQTINNISAYVVLKKNGEKLPLVFYTPGDFIDPSDTEGIPPEAEFVLCHRIPPSDPDDLQGVTIQEYLDRYGGFDFYFEYDGGKDLHFEFTYDFLHEGLSRIEKEIELKNRKPPTVVRVRNKK